jgi:hypothetical protein
MRHVAVAPRDDANPNVLCLNQVRFGSGPASYNFDLCAGCRFESPAICVTMASKAWKLVLKEF